MVAESVAAKIFKIGSVVFQLWPFYLITLWCAFVSITKNEHDETTYFESMERRDSLIALKCYLDICGHLSGQVLDPWVKVKVKGQVDLWGHKVGHRDLLWPRDLLGSWPRSRSRSKVKLTFGVIK